MSNEPTHSRAFCKYCNAYFANTKGAISSHNNGNRHRRTMDIYIKQNRNKKRREEGQRRRLDRELDSLASLANATARTGNAKITVPERHSVGRSDSKGQQERQQVGESGRVPCDGEDDDDDGDDDDRNEPVTDNGSQQVPGLYAIGDDWFLEGPYYQTLLVVLQDVQVYVEERDDWLDGIITDARIDPISFVHECTIDYVTAQGELATAANVPPEDIRLRATSEGQLLSEEDVKDEDTGLGVWASVVSDDEEESRITDSLVDKNGGGEVPDEEATTTRRRRRRSGSSGSARSNLDGLSDDDNPGVMGVYSGQHGRGNLGRIEAEANAIADGATVGFKKKKKKKRRIAALEVEDT